MTVDDNFLKSLNLLCNEYSDEISSFGMVHKLPMLPTLASAPNQYALNYITSTKSISHVLNCGGTNWQSVKVDIDSNGIDINPKMVTKNFSDVSSRHFESLETFVEVIAELLYDNIGEKDVFINSVALVLGFPQDVYKTSYGIDAKLVGNELTKGWYVGGNVREKMVGEVLMERMKQKYNIKINHFVCGNDAALMMWDLSVEISQNEVIAPIGGVWGSGTNVGVIDPEINEVVNTEMGSSIGLLTAEDIKSYERMKELKFTIPEKVYSELFVGGDYLLYLFVGYLHFLFWNNISESLKEYLLKECAKRGNADIVSIIAQSTSSSECKQRLGINFDIDKDFHLLVEVAKEVLNKISQKIALMLISAIQYSKISSTKNWVIPVEGGVIAHGYGIKENVNKIIKEQCPDLSIRLATDGSSKKALAIFSKSLSI